MDKAMRIGTGMFVAGIALLAVLIISWVICELMAYSIILKEILVGIGMGLMGIGFIIMVIAKK